MTQAFNLSQLANNLNSSGQLDASDGLTGAVPVSNGGTGLTTITAGYIPYGNGTGALSTSSNLVFTGSALGINCSPAYSLDVNGKIRTNGSDPRNIIDNGTFGIVMGFWDGANIRFEMAGGRPVLFTNYNSQPIIFGINGNGNLTLSAAGDLYAGTTATQNGATAAVYSRTTAKVWAKWNGTAGTLTASFNVSSLTKVGGGLYTVNFSSALADANYSVVTANKYYGSGYAGSLAFTNNASYPPSTTSVTLVNYLQTGGPGGSYDVDILCCAIFR